MSDYIDKLDAALAVSGEDVIIRRIVGTKNTTNLDIVVRANVRTVRLPEELVSGVSQDDLRVIISPSEIREAQWPGGGTEHAPPFNVDRSIPVRGDRLIVKGRMYRVETVNPIAVEGEVVRIEMMTKGGASGG